MEIYEGKRQKQESAKSSRSSSPEGGRDDSPGREDARFQPIARTPPSSRVGPPPSPPVPTHPIAPVPPDPSGPLPLSPCPVCGRTFVPQSLSKHVKICEKMTVKKRKTFDSSRQRREGLVTPNGGKSGTDLEQYLPKNFGLPENSPFLEKSPPQTAKAPPKPKPPSVKTAIAKPSADLQRCPHCNRTFGVRAFERHVEWCADKAKILPAAPAQPPPHIADAKQRLNARTQYKAPPVRGRRSSQSREKSSNSRSASVESSRGVSPPPPPREYGDYNKGRRASESVSSNDHEDVSPHVPVIRNTRNSQNCGDANVKARQARLARDLSSSSNKEPDSRPSSVQQSNTDTNVKKNSAHHKVKTRLDAKREQQLKRLEEISNKYNERKQKIAAQIKAEKSQIPVPKKLAARKSMSKTVIRQEENNDSGKEVIDSPKHSTGRANAAQPRTPRQTCKTNNLKDKEKKTGNKTRKEITKRTKESTISLDSLDEPTPTSAKDKTCQSIGINTELLCPCVPCVIHDAPDQKPVKKKSKVEKHSASQMTDDPEPKVELLYKNLNVVSSCNIRDEFSMLDSKEDLSVTNDISVHTITTSDNFTTDSLEPLNIYFDSKSESSFEPPVAENIDKREIHKIDVKKEIIHSLLSEKIEEENHELSAENFEEPYEHDLSEEMFDESADNKCGDENVNKNVDVISRHGSGDTYTKFTENPADLEEFMNMTDKMLNANAEQSDLDKELDNFRTPNTNSLEVLQTAPSDDNVNTSTAINQMYSDTFEELKSNLKELLKGVKHEKPQETTEETEDKRKVENLEHITVYELKFFERSPTKVESPIKASEFKLPSISETNKPERKIAVTKKRVQNIYKHNSSKILAEKSKAKKEMTFILKEQDDNSDGQSISAEAPPLKLPRIENKRYYFVHSSIIPPNSIMHPLQQQLLDDNYDPFLSAARQMKELMSSDTNLPKKVQSSSKDPNRTLPILRNSKEKPSLSYLRTDNTKMIKDSLNKTYQKTPTLQRMKSFGSTNNDSNNYSFGGRSSSFRVNRNEKKSSQKLNLTFTKSSKENISTTEKNYFNRSSNLNKSFSSYTTSAYSTPKPKDKIPKIANSMYHSFQRSTIKQPVKLDKIKREEGKKDFVNLDSILADDNSSMTDSNYIDPRLINENDNLPINVSTILNNPDIISSMESLLTTENLPAKYDTLIVKTENKNIECNGNKELPTKLNIVETNNNINSHIPPVIDNLSVQYDKIMSSLEQSIASKTSIRDDDSLCEDFDLEEFMTTFDDEINNQKSENKRTCSSTTRVVKQSELADSNKTCDLHSLSSSPKVVYNGSNGFVPVNKSMSLNFSSNNIVSESLFPSSVKRSTSLLDSIQKKTVSKTESSRNRQNVDKLEADIMQSLKDFDKLYEPEKGETTPSKDMNYHHSPLPNGPSRRESRVKNERKVKKLESVSNGNHTPNGKQSTDSAYSSLNRISPSKLSVCNSKDSNGVSSLEQIPAGSDSSGCQKDDIRSVSSDEFLAMERSAEMDAPLPSIETHSSYKDHDKHGVSEKRAPSRTSSRRSSNWRGGTLSSSGSEASLPRRAAPAPAPPAPAPRASRFCHECGARFPVDTAKFCIDCGVRRLVV